MSKVWKRVIQRLNLEEFKQCGGFDMLEYKFGSEEQLSQKQKKKQEILDKFNQIDNTFLVGGVKDSEDLNLDRLEKKALNEDKIKAEASEALKGYKMEELNSINEEYDTKKSKIDSEIARQKEVFESEMEDVKNASINAQLSAEKNAINRGVARGSILSSSVENIKNNELNELKNLKNDANSKILALNSELELLSTRKKNALEMFDIAYAVKLNEKIASLTNEIEKYNNDVIKYNNSIEEKEKEFALDSEKKYQDNLDSATSRNEKLLDFIKQYGSYALNYRVQEQKTKYIESLLDGLSPDEALEVLNDSEIIKHLGEENYQKLLESITKGEV